MRQKSIIHSIVVCAAVMLGLVAPQCDADFHMGVPRLTGPNVHSAQSDVEPCISGDGLSLYFASNREGAYYAIFQSQRLTQDSEWSTPEKLPAPVNDNGTWDTGGPDISFDGLTLYFSSGRPGTLGGGYTDIWMTTRASQDAPWGEPVNLGTAVNSSVADYTPRISRDELSLYFTSGRTGQYDIYVTTRTTKDDPWGPARRLEAPLNSSAFDGYPTLSSNQLTLFFSSERSGGYGDSDLWVSTRKSVSDPWGEPMNLGESVNTPLYDGQPELSWDQTTLYAVGADPAAPSQNGDLWEIPILPEVDFNGDYRIDIKDLTLLIEHWGLAEAAFDMGPTPLGDGIVDANDLEILMAYWGLTIYDPHLLAHWRLDETEGDIAHDCAGENHAVITGDPAWQAQAGQILGALALDGLDDCVTTPFILNPSETVFSVFLWFQGGTPGQVILSQTENVNWLAVNNSGCLCTNLTGEGRNNGQPLHSETTITDGQWHRIGVVWDGSYRSLYVDDQLVATDTTPQNNFPSVTEGLCIGAGATLDAGTWWQGLVDDVRIYNRVVVP